MRTLGIDLASAIANTAACVVEWEGGPPRVTALLGRDVDDDSIVRLATQADVTGIDAPFGWPRPFVDTIAAYASGAPWPRIRPEGLWLRTTDERAYAISGGRAPLSVSSDRIARPAERAARLLTLLGSDDRAAARDGSDNVIEVYPAGALRCWGISVDRYKRPEAISARAAIVEAIAEGLALGITDEDRISLSAPDDMPQPGDRERDEREEHSDDKRWHEVSLRLPASPRRTRSVMLGGMPTTIYHHWRSDLEDLRDGRRHPGTCSAESGRDPARVADG